MSEQRPRMRTRIPELTERDRQALRLRRAGKSNREIAAEMGYTVDSMHTILCNAENVARDMRLRGLDDGV